MNKKGFTLIELLVVIAIIGLLSTLAVVSLNNARSKSRDAKRIADVKQTQTALELYYNDCTQYPELPGGGTLLATFAQGCPVGISLATFMAQIPNAPTPHDGGCSAVNNVYVYTAAVDGVTYTIDFCLGGITGDLAAGPRIASPSGIQ